MTKEVPIADIGNIVRCPRCGYFVCEPRSKGIVVRLICRNKKCKANLLVKEGAVEILS